jgi:hypothetical protein
LDLTKDVSGVQSLLILCAVAIKEKLWLNERIHKQQEYYKQYCPHLVADAIRQPQPLPSPDSSIPLQSTTMESLLLQYGRIMNKLKKLKLLELERLSLIEENVTLAQELIESSLTEKLVQNFSDGVQLIGPDAIPSSSSSQRKHSTRPPLSSSSIESIGMMMRMFEEELQSLKDYDQHLEEDRNNEYLFWRWIASFPLIESISPSQSLLPTPTIRIVKIEESKETVQENVVSMHPSTVQGLQDLHTAMHELEDHIIHILLQKKASLHTSLVHSQYDRILTHFVEEIDDLTFASRVPHTPSSNRRSASTEERPYSGNLDRIQEQKEDDLQQMLGIPVLFPAFQMTPSHQILYQLLHWDHPILLQQQYAAHDKQEREEEAADREKTQEKKELFTSLALFESKNESLSVKQCEILQDICDACNNHSPYRVVFR